MADEPKGGSAAGEEAGESGAAALDPEPTETHDSATAGADDAETRAQEARDEYFANLAAQVAEKVVTRVLGERAQGQAPASPSAPPPTAGAGVVAELTHEKAQMEAEAERIERAVASQGLTGENLLAHQKLVQRESRWLAKVNLEATRMAEQERAVSGAGTEAEWRAFVAQYPAGTDVSLLRDAFERRQEKATAGKEKKPAPNLRRDPERPIVDVSGATEVSATEKKARTMTRAQADARKEQLRFSNTEEFIKFGRQLRSGEVIVKD